MIGLRTHAGVALAGCALALLVTSGGPAAAALPSVERLTLDNGLTVLLLPNSANPFVEVNLVVRGGTALDPAGKEGLAALTAAMLVNGTATRSEEAIAQELEGMGARLGARAGLDTLAIAGSVVTLDPAHLERFLGLFVDVVRQASFPEASLAKTRDLEVAGLKRLPDNHGALADVVLAAAVYGDGPRGRMASGTLSSLVTLTRQDLVAFRDAVIVPGHAVLAIAGDFDRKAMLAWARKHLGDKAWGKGACTRGDIPGRCKTLCAGATCFDNPMAVRAHGDRPAPQTRRVILVDRADPSINQIQWRLGADNPVTMLADTWAAFRLGAQVLGGDFTARLNSVLRVREGLTYGARFRVDYGGTDSGAMFVSTFVAPKDVKKAVDLALGEIAAVRAAPLPEAEVQNFKDKLINAYPFRFETVSSTLEQYLWLEVEGVPFSWLEAYPTALAAPTPATIHSAVQVIDPARMVLVAVGNKDLLPVLKTFGPVEVIPAQAVLERGHLALDGASATPAAAP